MRTIDKELDDKINFMPFLVTKFARAYKMNSKQAYSYLKQYGGLGFLDRHWWTLHVEDPYWSVKGLFQECYENGAAR
jgi:hypothetical protein